MWRGIGRILTGCTFALMVVATPGCGGAVRQIAMNAVASEITSANRSVIPKLASSANPTGQGVLVFVRASDCGPQYAWLWLNDGIPPYTVDSASQGLTPRLQVLSDAPADVWRSIGSEPKKYQTQVRDAICASTW